MKITKYIHSCLLVEEGTDKILFDPGKFSFVEGLVKPDDFKHLSAIVLTHYHPDHIDEDALEKIIKNNPDAELLANMEIHEKLAKKEIDVRVFEAGSILFGNASMEALDAPHEKVLADSIPQNTAYVLNDLLVHPGDSLSENVLAKKGTRVLALPLMAPWGTELQIFDFAVKMQPEIVIPIHDGFAKDFFLKARHENFEKFLKEKGIQFKALGKPGDSVVI
jgi:L-ascorbate metabolism protein UlaG (beta-lactamase superfamily)